MHHHGHHGPGEGLADGAVGYPELAHALERLRVWVRPFGRVPGVAVRGEVLHPHDVAADVMIAAGQHRPPPDGGLTADPPAGSIGIGRLIACLTEALAEDGVTPDTPVQLGPEFGARLDLAFVSGTAVSYLAGMAEQLGRPPRIVIEYRTARP